MKERKKFITEKTKIIIDDEEVFKIKAQRIFWEMLVEYANEKYKSPVLQLKL